MRPHSPRPAPRLPVVTLVPRSTHPVETWSYVLPGGQRGVAIGDAAWAARYVLNLADKRHWRGVVLRFPKARWGGLRSHDITVRNFTDLPRLRTVDIQAMMWRHGMRVPALADIPAWRWWLRGWPDMGLRMPVSWPAVP
jgi:hypothetical protein